MKPSIPKPPAAADRKALAAYYSELRRWAETLKQWEANLAQREADLDKALVTVEPDEDDIKRWEDDLDKVFGRVKRLDTGTEAANAAVNYLREEVLNKGDEVQWLENLHNLADKRRKKKQ